MFKKLLIICLVAVALVGVSYAQGSIGIKVPFHMQTTSFGNGESVSGSETWVGGLATFEYMVWPTFSLGLEAGYYMSLGGSSEIGDEDLEWKTNLIPVLLVCKYYFPMAEDAQFHPYFGCGAGFMMASIKRKGADDEYEDWYSQTIILFPDPRFYLGFDYDIAEAMKLGGVVDFAFQSQSTSFETSSESKNGDRDESMSLFAFGLGLTFKYCF